MHIWQFSISKSIASSIHKQTGVVFLSIWIIWKCLHSICFCCRCCCCLFSRVVFCLILSHAKNVCNIIYNKLTAKHLLTWALTMMLMHTMCIVVLKNRCLQLWCIIFITHHTHTHLHSHCSVDLPLALCVYKKYPSLCHSGFVVNVSVTFCYISVFVVYFPAFPLTLCQPFKC